MATTIQNLGMLGVDNILTIKETADKNLKAVRKGWVKPMSVKEIEAWALYRGERFRQGGGCALYPSSRTTAHLTGILAPIAHEVMQRLIYSRVGVKDLYGLCKLPNRFVRRRLMSARQKALYDRLEKTVKHLARISLKRNDEHVLRVMQGTYYGRKRDATEIKKLAKVKSGRELFIKGMGTFDVQTAFRDVLKSRLTPEIRAIQAVGYLRKVRPDLDFGSSHFESSYGDLYYLLHERVLDYTIRWWNQGQMLAVLGAASDELYRCFVEGVVTDDMLRLPPGELLVAARTLREARYARHKLKEEEYPKNVPYKAVYDTKILQDSGVLSQIRFYEELAEVGTKLHNCAATYHRQCAEGSSIMIVKRDANNHPVVLADVNPTGRINQIRKACNYEVDAKTRKEFAAYLKECKIK